MIAILSWWPWLEKEIAKKSANFFKKYINKDFDYYELPEQMEDFLVNKNKYNLVIPVFHWEYWEDGKVFAFLDSLNLKHSFSNYDTHSICLDKYKSNILVSSLWIKIPKQELYSEKTSINNFPIIVKPNRWGSSFHTYKASNKEELYDCLKVMLKEVNDDILIQDFIVWDEYSVPVVAWEVLPIMKLEKQSNEELFDYNSKYEDDSKIKEVFSEISEPLKSKLEDVSIKIYNFFNCKWFSRIDFLVRWDDLYFLEINTIPGMTEASILPKAWKLTWRDFEKLVKIIINN